ncbi:two-component system response regulator [Gammaproteobacteria bacterium 45_16_T64]|nr:two-component system response regulator [Gammaproteobacteria bacterium 45_16_T64]
MTTARKEATLLIVEDDDIDAMAIERSFKKLKLDNNLVRAKDGIEALEIMRGENGKTKLEKPYLILLDLNMPRMNGLEFLAALREDPELSDTVVIVLTTSAADQDQTKAYDQHVAGYIVKTEIKDSFLEVIELVDCYWKIVTLPA